MVTSIRPAVSLRSLRRPVSCARPPLAPARKLDSSFAPARARLVDLGSVRACRPPPPPVKPGPTIINQKLFDYLQANPEVRTVQQLVNQTYPKGQFESTCRALDLNPNELLKYRSAALMDLAVRPPPGDGTAPRTVEEANRAFITQYQNDTYNRESPNSWTNNCGPTSLAMVLKVNGKLPQGLTNEQQVDYARALMYPALAKTDGKDLALADGSTVRLLDLDKMLTNITAATAGARAGGLAVAAHERGWADFDAALNEGQSVVVEGNISSSWRTVFAGHQVDAAGNYQGGGNGHFIAVLGKTAEGQYLVADPMYTGGTVAMSRDELAVFFKQQGGEPSFVAP